MPLRSLQRLVWLHLVMPPKWQVTGRTSRELTWASRGEEKAGVALGDALCTEEDTAVLCQPPDTPRVDFNAEFFF